MVNVGKNMVSGINNRGGHVHAFQVWRAGYSRYWYIDLFFDDVPSTQHWSNEIRALLLSMPRSIAYDYNACRMRNECNGNAITHLNLENTGSQICDDVVSTYIIGFLGEQLDEIRCVKVNYDFT